MPVLRMQSDVLQQPIPLLRASASQSSCRLKPASAKVFYQHQVIDRCIDACIQDGAAIA